LWCVQRPSSVLHGWLPNVNLGLEPPVETTVFFFFDSDDLSLSPPPADASCGPVTHTAIYDPPFLLSLADVLSFSLARIYTLKALTLVVVSAVPGKFRKISPIPSLTPANQSFLLFSLG